MGCASSTQFADLEAAKFAGVVEAGVDANDSATGKSSLSGSQQPNLHGSHGGPGSPRGADFKELVFLHFNDVYHINPNKKEPVGGAARFSTVIKNYRELYPEAKLVFSGDVFNPSLLSTVTKGKHMVPVLNHLQIEAACMGNHDFDFGVEKLEELVGLCTVPWVMTNIIDDRTETKDAIAMSNRSIISVVNGVKVGFLGIAEEEWLCTIKDLPSWVKYVDKISAAKKEIKNLKSQGVQYIVALTHQREPNDVQFLKDVPEVDLVLGGHDHFWKVTTVNEKKVINSGTDFRELSLVRIKFNPRKTSDVTVDRLAVNSSVAENEEMKIVVEEHMSMLESKLGKELCVTTRELDVRTSSVRTQETAVGNFVTDIMRAEFNADCALLNSGSLRADIIYVPGTMTLKDWLDIIPIEDAVVLIKIKGKFLKKALNEGLSKWPAQEGRFPQVSGMTVTFDGSLPEGERLQDVIIGDKPCLDEKVYTLSTTMYLTKGGDGYASLARNEEYVVEEENARILPTMVRMHISKITSQEMKKELKHSIASIRSDNTISSLVRRVSVSTVRRGGLPCITPKLYGRMTNLSYNEEDGSERGSVTSSLRSAGQGTGHLGVPVRDETCRSLYDSEVSSQVSKGTCVSRRLSIMDPIPLSQSVRNILPGRELSAGSQEGRNPHAKSPMPNLLRRHLNNVARTSSAVNHWGQMSRSASHASSASKQSRNRVIGLGTEPGSGRWELLEHISDCIKSGDIHALAKTVNLYPVKATVNSQFHLPSRPESGYPDHEAPFIQHAIAEAQTDVLHWLLEHGAEVSQRSSLGYNAREFTIGIKMAAASNCRGGIEDTFTSILQILDARTRTNSVDFDDGNSELRSITEDPEMDKWEFPGSSIKNANRVSPAHVTYSGRKSPGWGSHSKDLGEGKNPTAATPSQANVREIQTTTVTNTTNAAGSQDIRTSTDLRSTIGHVSGSMRMPGMPGVDTRASTPVTGNSVITPNVPDIVSTAPTPRERGSSFPISTLKTPLDSDASCVSPYEEVIDSTDKSPQTEGI